MENYNDMFQLVVLDSPFENWEDPRAQELFGKMVSLKKKGYEEFYASGVLPVDTTDFLSTHVLLCEKQESGLYPVMGYKTVTLQKCRSFNQNFPGLSLVQNAKMPAHCEVVQSIIERCERNQRGLAYLGSWTVDPQYKKNRPAHVNLKEAFTAFYRMLYRDQNVSEVIIGGTLRFKTEKLFAELGHKPLAKDGEALCSIRVAHLVKEPVLVMHSADFNEFSGRAEEKWADVWMNKIYIADPTSEKIQFAS